MSTGADKDIDFVELRDIASDVAKRTSEYIIQESREVVPHGIKSSSTDYVTEIDKRAEMLIVDLIKDSRPHDGFLGEEGTSQNSCSNVQWVIDPIDGTTNFIYGHSGFGPSIAAKVEGRIVAGAVADSSRGEVFDAAEGHGARCNGERICCQPER